MNISFTTLPAGAETHPCDGAGINPHCQKGHATQQVEVNATRFNLCARCVQWCHTELEGGAVLARLLAREVLRIRETAQAPVLRAAAPKKAARKH